MLPEMDENERCSYLVIRAIKQEEMNFKGYLMIENKEQNFSNLGVNLENLSYQVEHQMKLYDNICVQGLNIIGVNLESNKERELYSFFLHQMKIFEYLGSDVKKSLALVNEIENADIKKQKKNES